MLSKHWGAPFKHLVATLSTILVLSILVAGCTNSNDDESTRPAVAQDVVTPEVTGSELENGQGVFLRVIAPLDEARGYCLDIPGHVAGVRIASPLQTHTCKHVIWNQDGRFDVAALGNGVILIPHYELCLQADNTSVGARLFLEECTEAELQSWTQQDSGEIVLEAFPQMCITVKMDRA